MCYIKTDGNELCILYLTTGLCHTKSGRSHKVVLCSYSYLPRSSQDINWNNSSFLTQEKITQRVWKYLSSSGRCYCKQSLLNIAFFSFAQEGGSTVAVTGQKIKQSTWSLEPEQYNAAKVGDKACKSFQIYSGRDLSFGQVLLCIKDMWIFIKK